MRQVIIPSVHYSNVQENKSVSDYGPLYCSRYCTVYKKSMEHAVSNTELYHNSQRQWLSVSLGTEPTTSVILGHLPQKHAELCGKNRERMNTPYAYQSKIPPCFPANQIIFKQDKHRFCVKSAILATPFCHIVSTPSPQQSSHCDWGGHGSSSDSVYECSLSFQTISVGRHNHRYWAMTQVSCSVVDFSLLFSSILFSSLLHVPLLQKKTCICAFDMIVYD